VFGRKPKLSAKLTPALDRNERVLAWARARGSEDAVVVVTNYGLWLPGREAQPGAEAPPGPEEQPGAESLPGPEEQPGPAAQSGPATRLGWHEIHKAAWAEGTLTVTGSSATPGADYSIAADVQPLAVRIDDPGAVPRRVRERVNASVAFTSAYPVPGGGSARVVARRVAGRDGLAWSVRFEGAAAKNQDDPAVRAVVDQSVADAKASILATT